MTIKIAHSVPIPQIRGSSFAYPFADMKIGDSFELPQEKRGSIATAASYFSLKHYGYKFTVRKVGDKVRVWRIAATNGKK